MLTLQVNTDSIELPEPHEKVLSTLAKVNYYLTRGGTSRIVKMNRVIQNLMTLSWERLSKREAEQLERFFLRHDGDSGTLTFNITDNAEIEEYNFYFSSDSCDMSKVAPHPRCPAFSMELDLITWQ